MAFAAPIMAFAATQRRRTCSRHHAIRGHAAVPVLGHVLPDELAAESGCSRWRGSRRCGTASTLCRALMLGTIGDVAGWPSSTSRSWSRSVVGWVGACGRSSKAGGNDRRRPARSTPVPLGSRRACGSSSATCSVYRHGWLIILSGLFEPLLYLLDRHRSGRSGREGARARRSPDPVPAVRRAGAARGVGDERRGARNHVQLLLQAASTTRPSTRCWRRRCRPATSLAASCCGR